MISSARKLFLPALAAAFIVLSAAPVRAEDEGLFPPQVAANAPEYELSAGEDTHPMIRLTPEKSEIINLDTDVKSLIVGNPLHLNVIMDTTKRLVLVPRSPGATSFTAIDENGKIIMQRHVIVNGPDEKYIRIRRSCNAANTIGANARNCENMSMYYCPEKLCHQVNMVTSSTFVPTSGNGTISSSGGGGSSGGLGRANTDSSGGESPVENDIANPFELLMRALQNGAQGEQPAE